jgi:hypothetical protein
MRLSAVAGYRGLVSLTEEQRKELTGWAYSRTLPARRCVSGSPDSGVRRRDNLRGDQVESADHCANHRHGTLSLYAPLDVKAEKVQGKTAKRHTGSEFIAFLSEVMKRTRWAKEIRIVLDNLSAHKTQGRRAVPRRAF